MMLLELTFAAALERALAMRGSTLEQHAMVLESLPTRTMPIVRAETGISSSQYLDLSSRIAMVSVDYPLFERGEDLKLDAYRLRERAYEEAQEVFEQTLDAYADLYTAQRRLERLRTTGAKHLRERARTLLEAGQISNVTAAQWQDQALAAESMLVDLELQRLDAETRLEQLTGIAGPIGPLGLLGLPRGPNRPSRPSRPSRPIRPMRSLLLSGFAGAANSTIDGTFGIYGMRFTLTLDPAAARRAAQERIAMEEAERAEALEQTKAKNRRELLQQQLQAVEQRVALLTQSIDIARQREESVVRLVSAGVRTEADAVATASDIARRESELVGA